MNVEQVWIVNQQEFDFFQITSQHGGASWCWGALGGPSDELLPPPSHQVTQAHGLPGQLADHLDVGTAFSLIVWDSLSMKCLEMSRLSLDSFQL